MTDFPHADSNAARMLSEGLKRASIERGDSIRKLGAKLGFKQPVALSHMASGRMPIPIDRAPSLAQAIGLDERLFLQAVLAQRHPAIDWKVMFSSGSPVVGEEARLSAEKQSLIKEVVDDRWPRERWLSLPELPFVLALRRRFPHFRQMGLTAADFDRLSELRDADLTSE